MGIEDVRTFFRQRLAAPEAKLNLSDWEYALEQLKKRDPNDGNFYMLTANKGTPHEARSRFLTHAEAMQTIMYEIEKAKCVK